MSPVSPEEPKESTVAATVAGRDQDDRALTSFIAADHIKKYFIFVMIGGLVISSIIAVVAVFLGNYGDVIAKSFLTTISTVIHTLIALAIISGAARRKNPQFDIIINTIFGIAVISLMVHIFLIWDIISSTAYWDFYLIYIYAVLAACFCTIILLSDRSVKIIRQLADITIYFVLFYFLLIIPSAFANVLEPLPELYGRGVGASSIILATLAVLTLILQNLYAVKKPQPVVRIAAPVNTSNHTEPQPVAIEKKPMSPAVLAIIILVIIIFGFPILGFLVNLISLI